jgi:hypothetical protein
VNAAQLPYGISCVMTRHNVTPNSSSKKTLHYFGSLVLLIYFILSDRLPAPSLPSSTDITTLTSNIGLFRAEGNNAVASTTTRWLHLFSTSFSHFTEVRVPISYSVTASATTHQHFLTNFETVTPIHNLKTAHLTSQLKWNSHVFGSIRKWVKNYICISTFNNNITLYAKVFPTLFSAFFVYSLVANSDIK